MKKMVLPFMLLVVSPSYAESIVIDLGQAQGAPFVLFGNVLPDSVYHFQARITVNGQDTTSQKLMVNGLAIDLDDSVSIDVPQVKTPRQLLEERVNLALDGFHQVQAQRSLTQLESRQQLVEFLAQEYAKDTAQVLRTAVVSDREFMVCWKVWESMKMCERFTLNKNSSPVKMTMVQRAEVLRNHINHHRAVFITTSRGNPTTLNPSRTAEFQAALNLLKKGESSDFWASLLDQRIVRDLRQPSVTVEKLRQEAQ